MKESEIKHALEKIHWAILGALDTIDRYNDIVTEHLEKTGNETEEAVKLVISLCDYMIDDGKIELSEDLQIIHDEATKITCGEYGEIPKEAKTDELQPLLDRILINIANIRLEIQHYWEWEAQNKADSSATDKGMGNNATTNPQTPPAAKETQLSVLPPYTPKSVGRPTGDFVTTIKDTYKDKAEIIKEHTKTALETMTDPKAVIALFIVYFQNDILKQCPTYWQTLRLLDIEADTDREKANLCPFGSYQGYDRQRALYFAQGNKSLNATNIEQNSDISSCIQAANSIYITLRVKLTLTPQKEIPKGA